MGVSEFVVDRLVGSWCAATVQPEVISAHVGDESEEAVGAAVRRSLSRFLVDDEPVKLNAMVRSDSGWSMEADGVTIASHASGITVTGHRQTWTLDPLVGRSIACEVARVLDPAFDARSVSPKVIPDPDDAEPVAEDLIHRLQECARKYPERVAVRRADATLDYATLMKAADRCAADLDAAGVGSVVVVRFDGSIDCVVRLVAIVSSGRAHLLISGQENTQNSTDADRFAAAQDQTHDNAAIGPHTAAYIQFTSGTTGKPKAVVIERSQLSAYCAFLGNSGLCGPEVTMPVLSSPEFDAIIKQIWGQLAAGGTVDLTVSGDVLREIDLATTRPGVTINTVPTVWRQYLDVASTLPIVASGTLLLGGEALDPALVVRTRALWPGVRIVNLYGPVETTANATWTREVDVTRDRTAIGTAIDGSVALVLDSRLEPVPVGGVGSLFIAGASVSRGYQGDSRRTAESFLPAPHSTAGSRMYATGDRVRLTSGGLVFLGRIDSRIKLKGVLVDLEALRADIAGLDGVDGVAVVAEDDTLVVYLEAIKDASAYQVVSEHITANWRRELSASRVVLIPSIPRTPTGKTDFAALRSLRGHEGDGGSTAPSTDLAHPVLAVIWRNVLGTDNPVRSTSIADLGGDSMKQLKIVALYRRILKVDVSLQDFRTRDSLGDHQDLLLEHVDSDHLDRIAGSLERADR